MKIKDIVMGATYRHRESPNSWFARPISILKPKSKRNPHTYTIVECEWCSDANFTVGTYKYFRPWDLIIDPKSKKEEQAHLPKQKK